MDPEGVGGRRPGQAPLGRGGGSRNDRTSSKFSLRLAGNSRDRRVDELRAMGLSKMWLRIADTIGYDSFIAMWKVFDDEPSARTDVGNLEVKLRPFHHYLRYQRNRYVESLAAVGMTWGEIQKKVRDELCEKVSRRHITRLMKGN